MATISTSEHRSQFVTCKAFLQDRDWPTQSSLRYYIFFNKYGFADTCVRRVGRKVLIDPQAFEVWVRENAR
jgi:hypothetical protein